MLCCCSVIVGALKVIEVRITKCEIVKSLEGTDSKASGIRGDFPQTLKYQDLCSIGSWVSY
jgi:hypothetical protein